MLPKQGKCFQRQKGGHCIRDVILAAIPPDPGMWKQSERQVGAEAEREWECINTRAGGRPQYNSKLINKETVGGNEQEIKNGVEAESVFFYLLLK